MSTDDDGKPLSEASSTKLLRTEKDCQWLAYPHKLTVELGSYVDGEAHGWAQ